MDKKTVQIHDGIVGVLLILSTLLGYKLATAWFCLAGTVGVLMVISAVTGFCPVYYLMGLCGLKKSK